VAYKYLHPQSFIFCIMDMHYKVLTTATLTVIFHIGKKDRDLIGNTLYCSTIGIYKSQKRKLGVTPGFPALIVAWVHFAESCLFNLFLSTTIFRDIE